MTVSESQNAGQRQRADHLCVLVHGLWGNPNHLSYLATALREKYADDRLHILVAKRNAGSFTYDGIELGGERVAQEVEDKLDELRNDGDDTTKFSIVGYSLGGLVARYAIGLLYAKGLFDTLEPINFTTFATPHLGARTPLLGIPSRLWNVLGARTLSTSGRQLFTVDTFRDTGRPLLSVLADPQSIFIRALSQFRNLVLYANVVNDRSAVYYTTGISKNDPFISADELSINYIKGYEPVVIDATIPISRKDPEPTPNLYARLARGSQTLLTRVPVVAILLVLIPIGSAVFLVSSVIQTVRSQKRIRLHEEGKAGIGIGSYRVPIMIENARNAVEGAFENMNASHNQEYLPYDRDMAPDTPATLSEDGDQSDHLDVGLKHTKSRQGEFPTLALTPEQFSMIEALDDLHWKKFPVYIHNVRHTHAAIIVRSQRKSFAEGKVVVRHWLDEQFEI